MFEMNIDPKLILMLLPVILLQFGLQAAALVNMSRRERVIFNNKIIWALIILLGQIPGSLVYFVAHSAWRGREE